MTPVPGGCCAVPNNPLLKCGTLEDKQPCLWGAGLLLVLHIACCICLGDGDTRAHLWSLTAALP